MDGLKFILNYYCKRQHQDHQYAPVDWHLFFTGIPEPALVRQARSFNIMASAASTEATTNEENILEFSKKDNRRMLHVVYRVGDLDKTIKYSTYFSLSFKWIGVIGLKIYNAFLDVCLLL